MPRIRNKNYYVTCGWMVNELHLKGRELQLYAIIYGFTQDGSNEFNGSLTYIMEWLGTKSKHTVIDTINKLVTKNLVEKKQKVLDGVKVNFYKALNPRAFNNIELTAEAVQKPHRGGAETAPGASAETAPGASAETAPNIYSNNKVNNNNNDTSAEEPEEKDSVPYQALMKLYNQYSGRLPKVTKMGPQRKKKVAARWKEYKGDIKVFVSLFQAAGASSFLAGDNQRHWRADFDWIMNADNMIKIMEGRYSTKSDRLRLVRPAMAAQTTAELDAELRASGYDTTVPDFDAMYGGGEHAAS